MLNTLNSHARMLYLHALTPIHSGTGQAVDVIDLPIAREKATGWPIIPGSSVKGTYRAMHAGADWATAAFGPETRNASDPAGALVFGPEPRNASDSAGALAFGDQRILTLPVRSFHGTFAQATSPLALTRWRRDLESLGLEWGTDEIPPHESDSSVLCAPGAVIASGGNVILEDFTFTAASSAAVKAIAERMARAAFPENEHSAFVSRLLLLSDTVFGHLSKVATEVSARVRLERDRKTVVHGALWYEEAVPAEALFSGPVLVGGQIRDAERRKELAGHIHGGLIQIGGKAGTGHGLCRVQVESR